MVRTLPFFRSHTHQCPWYCRFCDSVNVQCSQFALILCMYVCMYVEGKIYSWTDIISDRILQRSKHGSNCARSSEQQDMLALG